mmetsp:Transcript_12349/g.40597  ORF Transcript_12349/g.40597 Transcript_12349/m.40597 type:complete len:219 (-) Transcript_12349:245-901(-)
MRISSTWALRRTSPPCFLSPATSASAIAGAPPTGNSEHLSASDSPNTETNSAAMVPAASTPLRRKHSRSIKRLRNGSRHPSHSMSFEVGPFTSAAYGPSAASGVRYRPAIMGAAHKSPRSAATGKPRSDVCISRSFGMLARTCSAAAGLKRCTWLSQRSNAACRKSGGSPDLTWNAPRGSYETTSSGGTPSTPSIPGSGFNPPVSDKPAKKLGPVSNL